ncbi:hypothetical protein J2X31_003273 [Flavobacterium arsenatis]|uniref:Uncharacterized protein n=1 Tax=Flavobacterium arsenatis TaxID=1484332 RepID=A0ABU1TTS9_9FLAO|nr:hypothetical protein [Flavobacterium arsenatis]MDR6969246.1 hypothetical protein [Flavobacterium arsenatis]
MFDKVGHINKLQAMVKKLLYILLIFGLSNSGFAQSLQLKFENKLVEHFQKHTWKDVVVTRDSLYSSPYKDKFNVSVSDNYIEFDTTHLVIKNPYFSDKHDDAEEEKDYVKNFPKSFSVIYENSLVTLFENGKFTCFKLENFERNTELENKLNTKKFKYHWIIDNQLGGLSGNSIFLWNGNKWTKFKENFPLKNQPKLFEDNQFIVYGECFGEWGGTVYFFEKSSSKTFFTESTCANSVIKTSKGYNVLAHLGHGGGSAEIKTIPYPTKLTLAKPNEIGKSVNGEALGYTDKSSAFEKKLDFYGLQIFSSFDYQDKVLYIVHLSELTFIAEIKNNEIEIVNPLFFNDLYTHDPITNKYGKYTLMNLDHYGTGLNREISVLIIEGNKITKLDWNENHSR